MLALRFLLVHRQPVYAPQVRQLPTGIGVNLSIFLTQRTQSRRKERKMKKILINSLAILAPS